MDQAMHWGLIARNPTELVNPPRPARREMTALSGDQLQRLLQHTTGTQWHPLWVLLGTSGLRLGEALGLHWLDIDLAARRLAVRCALQRQRGNGLVLVPPENAAKPANDLPVRARRIRPCGATPTAGGSSKDRQAVGG
jgi:integrase